MSIPTNALGLIRLSDLRTEDLNGNGGSDSLDDQERRIRGWCDQRGWRLAEVLVENDLTREGKPKPASAYKRRKVQLPNGRVEYRVIRPVFRDAVDRLATGRNDGLVAIDLDRAVRDPRDLEDLVDLAEQHEVTIESVTGSLRLATDADVTMARVMVAVANKESRDKARRVSAARERQALAGQYGGGRRPYGFDDDGITRRPAECEAIVQAAYALLRGASLRGLARDLRDQGIPTVTGRAQWSAETLRDVLLRPRNAGRMVYQGQVMGTAPWEPVIPGDVHDRVVQLLTDEKRDTRAGTAPRWLGSGLYLCGVCDDGTTCEITIGGRAPRYRCRRFNHLARAQADVDQLVALVVMERVTTSTAAADLLTPDKPEIDADALRAERAAIEENLTAMAADAAIPSTGVTRAQLHAANRRGRARIAEIDQALADDTNGPDPTAVELATADDPYEVWADFSLEQQRQMVAKTVTVTILPAGRRGRGFDSATVRIVPRQAS